MLYESHVVYEAHIVGIECVVYTADRMYSDHRSLSCQDTVRSTYCHVPDEMLYRSIL